MTLGLQDVNVSKGISFFFDGPPIFRSKKKTSIFLKSRKNIHKPTTRRQVRALAQSLAGLGAKAFNWFQFPGLGVERYHEWRSRRKTYVFIYRRKTLIINILMIGVAFLFIKFLSLLFELIVKIAFCFLKIRL